MTVFLRRLKYRIRKRMRATLGELLRTSDFHGLCGRFEFQLRNCQSNNINNSNSNNNKNNSIKQAQ